MSVPAGRAPAPASARAATPLRDALARFVVEGAAVRGAVVSLDATLRDILGNHPYPPAPARMLAEFAAAAALLASTLKFKGSLVVQLASEGPVRLAVVECDASLDLRGTAQWRDEAAALPADAPLAVLAGDLARARLVITLDPKDGGPIYQGVVAITGGSIAELIEHYLATSEQIDSRMALVPGDDGVRGLLVQRLPGAGPDDDDAWRRVVAAVDALDRRRLAHAETTAGLVAAALPEEDVRLFAARAARFACPCSEARVETALRLLGRAEIESLLAERGDVEVSCEFCNRRYALDPAAARALFTDDSSPS
jgi:molecular chaperone Hsp33